MTPKLVPEPPDKTQHVNSRESSSPLAQSFHSKLHPVYQLHRTLGNRQVARLIQTNQLTTGGKIVGLQRTLTVGAADAMEAEAPTEDLAIRPAARTIAREPAAGPYATVGAGTPSADGESQANALPTGVMTGGFWGCLLGGCQPEPDPNARPVNIDEFRTSGKTSDENKCEFCPRDLGVLQGVGRNGMELRATVNGYVPGVEYDFKRERKRRTFERIDGLWRFLTGTGKDDDTDNSDESLTPVNGHIYAIDQPGAIDPQNPSVDPAATEFVQKLSMTEWVIVRKGPAEAWERGSNNFYWHSVVWLRKVNGVWQTDMEKSEIGPGTIYVDTKEP